ncbi:MAG: PAS-domain containing protein [Candidatus Omnitrophica bacterium]|nr:PAS-domain containing protein [Candidatus Omnitrophota bacterium]
MLSKFSIRHKLTLMIMTVSLVALSIASIAFIVQDIKSYKSSMATELETLAAIIGNNSSAAIVFDDQDSARQILSALKAKPHIISAFLLRSNGTVMARYGRNNTKPRFLGSYKNEGWHFLKDRFSLTKNIFFKDKYIGAVHIDSDLGEIYARLEYNFVVGTVVILIISICVFWAASILQGWISGPILQLARATKDVTRTQNYSIQMQKRGDDEIGELFDGFNQMMKQIQSRDLQLTQAKDELEQRVEKRTQELKKTNEDLTQLLSLHDATLEATADGILVVDLKGRIVGFNHNFLKLWDIPEPLAAGGEDGKVIMYARDQVADPESFVATIQEHYAKPEGSFFDLVELKDGRIYERFSHPQRIEDRVVGRVWSFHDITKRRQTERDLQEAYNELKSAQSQLVQSEKMASIGQLAAGVAHEINNPLGFISNNMELLGQYVGEYTQILRMLEVLKKSMEEGDMGKARATIKEIDKFSEEIQLDYIMNDTGNLLQHNQRGLERIQKIVLDLKTFAREGNDNMELLRVEEIIDSILSIVHNEIKYKAELKKDYGQTPLVKCSAQRMGQVFINMFVNAAQAIEDKGTIEVKTYTKDGYVCTDISDTGKGISPENLKKIFDPFFTTKPIGKGTGLGLSVSHEIIKKHNGHIKVRSKVGEGTVFTVMLPAVVSSAAE